MCESTFRYHQFSWSGLSYLFTHSFNINFYISRYYIRIPEQNRTALCQTKPQTEVLSENISEINGGVGTVGEFGTACSYVYSVPPFTYQRTSF